jgi:hypothetical protein
MASTSHISLQEICTSPQLRTNAHATHAQTGANVQARKLNGGNRQVATHGKMHVIANSQGGILKMGTNFQARTQAKVQTKSNS